MKRQVVVILAVVFFVAGCAGTAKITCPVVSEAIHEKIAEPKPSLTMGEKFTFRATWKGILVGRATATVEKLMAFHKYEVYKIVVVAKTTPFLDKLFRVEDTFISYVDKDKLISRHYENTIREGKYKKDTVIDYDFEKGIASCKNLRDGTVKTCPIEKDVQDPVSASYYFRTMPIKAGELVKLIVNMGEKNYEVFGDIEKTANINIADLGMFEAFLIKPSVSLDGKPQRKGKAWGYVSADERRLPLYIVVKVLALPWIGEVAATLENIEYISPTEN